MQPNPFHGILAQAAQTASAPAPATGQTAAPAGLQALMNSPIPMLVLFAVIFYFILIRPQQKRAKEQAKMLSALKSGDKVVTSGGIIGTVVTVKDATVSLRSADAKFEVTKASVAQILDASTPSES